MNLRNRSRVIRVDQGLDLSSEVLETINRREKRSEEDPIDDFLYYKRNKINYQCKYHGRCLILNYMENHDHLGQRLHTTFSNLNYQCKIQKPLSASKTRELLRDESKSFQLSYDSFILCILCKQPPPDVDFQESLVCAQNTCLPLDTVIQIFRGDKCLALANKPKIIIFQTFPATGLTSDVVPTSLYLKKPTKLLPVYGNFLIYKYSGSSSAFIETLCDVLSPSYRHRIPARDLIAKLTIVSSMVHQQTRRMAQMFSTLIKLLEI